MSAIELGPRYEYLRDLGSGGMGRVLLVRDRYLGKELALKLLHHAPGTVEDLESFQREFALLCEIEHPRVAKAHDFGFHDGRPYFTSELVVGPTLTEWSAARGQRMIELALEIAEALAFLHSNRILHLDLKPSNIIVAAANGRRGPVLIDFGLFRRSFVGPPGPRIKGALPYMAPEYFTEGPLSPRTDIYALGVTLYRIAKGCFPRAGPTEESSRLGDERAWVPAPHPPSEAGGCPPSLDGIILKCLALEPGSRFESGGELLDSLRRVSGAQGSAVPPDASVSSLIGRGAELAKIDAFIRGIREPCDVAPVLLVTAPPGMGQTHVLRELKVRAQTRGLEVYLETGYPGRAGPPGSLLRALCGRERDERDEIGGRWADLLARLARPTRPPPFEATEGERRLRRAAAVGLAASSVTEPMIIAVDGLQHWDEVSIALLFDLIRFILEKPAAQRPPIGVVAAFREEGTSAAILRELTAYLLEPGRAEVVSLGPLGLRESLALFRERSGRPLEPLDSLGLFQRTRGVPAEIVATARRSVEGGGAQSESGLPIDVSSVGADGRAVLLTLALLKRPSARAELSRCTRIPARKLALALRRLAASGLIQTVEQPSGYEEWMPSDASARAAEAAWETARRRFHRAIADALLRTGRQGASLVEAVRHLHAAGCRRAVQRHGLAAAAYLKSTHQNRAAIELLRSVLDAAPRGQSGCRLEAALEAADLHARVGELGEGIRLLRELLPQARKRSRAMQSRVLLRLACLHSRSGDYARADSLLRETASLADRGAILEPTERLTMLNEHAGLKVIVGEHSEAIRLCEEGLRIAGRSREPGLREAALNLHATRANVSLRVADFEGAIRSYVSSLEIAETIGSPANQAAILNNLGIVYSQCDRYEEAISAFHEAERTSLHLDEGPSLASIYGNLAVLHSKSGDFQAMERALDAGERLLPGAIGKRQELFLKHARGLSLLNRGRYREARKALEDAIALGTAMGDGHVVAFDEVYRAEALIFEAAYGEAGPELERLAAASSPGRIRKMALARLAFFGALTARHDVAQSCRERYGELSSERPIPFLDAWEGLFLAWALSIEGKDSIPTLDPAAQFFESKALVPAARLARWIREESRMLDSSAGRPPRHAAAPCETSRPANDLLAVLESLLEGRRLLAEARTAEARARCADLFAGAAANLAGNPLPEWSARVEALRALLRPDRSAALTAVARGRDEIARGMASANRREYLESAHWRAWTSLSVPEPARDAPGAVDEASTTALFRRTNGAPSRSRLVARSPRMRRVIETLDRLRHNELPVLLRGETGTGKELLARVIHEESSRGSAPFQVVDCATIPLALLESELFGARAGSFTGIDSHRAGIFAACAGGSVLIDAIDDAPLELQAKLLRVLSEGKMRAVGSDEEAHVDVRFLFSSSRDLDLEVRRGKLRADLLYRIRVITLEVPSLRDRPEDLEGLLASILSEEGATPPTLGRGSIEALRDLPWPGNVRELRNFLSRLRLECPEAITAEAIDRLRSEPKTTSLFPRNLLARDELTALKAQLERDYIVYHFRRLGGDTDALRRFLGVGRRQLYRRCARLGVVLREVKEK